MLNIFKESQPFGFRAGQWRQAIFGGAVRWASIREKVLVRSPREPCTEMDIFRHSLREKNRMG